MQDITIKNNKFIKNKGDIVSCAGDNIIFEGNEFSSKVAIWGRTTNYKFLNNRFLGVNEIVSYEYSTDVTMNGNLYRNSRLRTSKIADKAKINMQNEIFENSSITMTPVDEYIKNSVITNDGKTRAFLEGTFENCIIRNVSDTHLGSLSNVTKLYNCKIDQSDVNIKGSVYLEGCTIKNSNFYSTTNTKAMNFNKSSLQDSNFLINTWGNTLEMKVENSKISMDTKKKAFIDISAGKMKKLTLKNNEIINNIEFPTLNLYDTQYTTPNSSIIIENNTIAQTKYKYIFDGKDINSGIVNFTQKNNTLNGAEMLNPKYINNQYFKIIN